VIPLSYLALYRKWRPKVFEDVIGQEHITRTLKNQIKNQNIAHAYLFCGTRGTGKTSTAKIFAKAVNCLSPQDMNPCGTCEICRGIDQESIMDVIEIDAASNNGVDDIRELRENVQYPPSKGKYKVYIIDEVHMLSTGAFNALLKTLEEPPGFVIFIFATTEPHKIPATIISRCQRFDFKRVREPQIVERLRYICSEMNITADEKALRLIARNADGSLRDALSILDQCISFQDEALTYSTVLERLGIVGEDAVFQLVDYVIEKDAKKALEWLHELVAAGKDIQQIFQSLIQHYRNLMLIQIIGEAPEGLVRLSEESIQRCREQAKKLNPNHIMRGIPMLSQMASDAKYATQPRILLEMAVLKLIRPQFDKLSVEGLLERIEDLEKQIRNVPAVPQKRTESQQEQPKPKPAPTQDKMPEPKEAESKIEPSEELKEEKLKGEEIQPASSGIDFDHVRGQWEKILKEVKKKRISAHAMLIEGKPVGMQDGSLIIVFRKGFEIHKDMIAKSYREIIETAIEEVTGQKVHLKCMMEEDAQSLFSAKEQMSVASAEGPEKEKEEEEVKKIIELFGEDVVEIIDE